MESEYTISPLKKSIIRTLAYYDIFSYPLTADEIYFNLGTNHTSEAEVLEELKRLTENNLIFTNGKYYLLNNDENNIARRENGNKLAEKKLKTARRVSGFIARFPFIRGIMLSGSISKGFMEDDSDIDYFIITHPNRVWFSRLILMLFKKTFLLNSKKIFCVNYFVDAENLEIQEKNIFTATELVTLVPTFGKKAYDDLFNHNSWIKQYYPNFPKRELTNIIERKNGIVKSLLENIMGKSFGDRIDDYAMNLFDRHNKKIYKDFNYDDFRLAFKSNKKESKHHPKFMQKKILQEFEKKIKLLEEKFGIPLN